MAEKLDLSGSPQEVGALERAPIDKKGSEDSLVKEIAAEESRLEEFISATRSGLKELRDVIGLPHDTEDPPSIVDAEKKLESIRVARETSIDPDDYEMVPLGDEQKKRAEREAVWRTEEEALPEEVKLKLKAELESNIKNLESRRELLKIIPYEKTGRKVLEDIEGLSPREGTAVYIPSDVSRLAEDMRKSLGNELESASFGPVYRIKSSAGEELIVRNASYFGPGGSWGTEVVMKSVLLATDLEGKLLGMRGVQFEDGGRIAQGTVITLERGRGAASAIDTALVHLLQRMSDVEGRNIEWQVNNENLAELQKMEASGASALELDSKEAEQMRWQSMYGTGGKFGLTAGNKADGSIKYDSYHRKFVPLINWWSQENFKGDSPVPEERVKYGFREELMRKRELANIGEVILTQSNKEITAREAYLDSKEESVKKKDILKKQIATILQQLSQGDA